MLVSIELLVHIHPSLFTVVEPGERALGGKRKLLQRGEPASKRVKVPAYFLPDVAQCVAMTDVKLPLTHLSLKVGVTLQTKGIQLNLSSADTELMVISPCPSPLALPLPFSLLSALHSYRYLILSFIQFLM